MEALVRRKVEEGAYATAEEVVNSALRRLESPDAEAADSELENQLIQGLESPMLGKMTAADWEGIRSRAIARLRK